MLEKSSVYCPCECKISNLPSFNENQKIFIEFIKFGIGRKQYEIFGNSANGEYFNSVLTSFSGRLSAQTQDPLDLAVGPTFTVAESEICRELSPSGDEEQNGARRWLKCSNRSNESFSISGFDSDELVMSLVYEAESGPAILSVESGARFASISSEFGSDQMLLNAVSTEASESQYSADVTLFISANECASLNDARDKPHSLILREQKFSESGSFENDLREFLSEPTVSEAAFLVEEILLEMAEDGVLEDAKLNRFVGQFIQSGSVDPSLMSLEILIDASRVGDQTITFSSCALLAAGAAGALAQVFIDNPTAGVACSGSCGGALVCLATLAGGGTFTPQCGVLTGGCLGCVGLGYASLLDNCITRVFFKTE